MVAHSLYFAEATEITCFIFLFHACFISMTKSVNTEFKATIHTFFIQKKNNNKNVNMSIECLFFMFRSYNRHAMHTNEWYSTCMHGLMCCRTDDIPKNSMLHWMQVVSTFTKNGFNCSVQYADCLYLKLLGTNILYYFNICLLYYWRLIHDVTKQTFSYF